MMNYHDKSIERDYLAQGYTRTHPWTSSISDESHRYYDFINHPELVETSLEDFVPFARYPAVATFYDLIRWLNGPESIFESNDCALSNQIGTNTDRNTALIAQQPYRISGRLIFFFRDHILNADEDASRWLWNGLPREFDDVDQKFKLGVIGFSKVLTAYSSLPAPLSELSYSSFCLTFFAWGANEVSVMSNLNRLFSNTRTALKKLSRKGEKKQLPEKGRALLQSVLDNHPETVSRLITPWRL